jgi:putative ABC transport system permease protein
MSFLRLFNRFVVRALWREKTRSTVSVLAIALGIAVMTAIRLANSSVIDTFEAAVDSVSGRTSLRIRGTAGRFDETLLTNLQWLGEFGQVSPVVEAYAMYSDQDRSAASGESFSRGEILHVLGVDVLLDFPLRDYHVLKTADTSSQHIARDVLRLLNDPHSIILTEKFLRRHNLRVGGRVALTFGSRRQWFEISGVLLNQGPARTMAGNFALMDIGAAQWASDQLGRINYVDLLADDKRSVEPLQREIASRLPTGLVVELPDAASARADTMISAFQFNLTALSLVALIVGIFLIYNTVAISVAARRVEIGTLQAIGAGRTVILLLFLTEALLLASVGVLLGLPLGRLLAVAAVNATAQTVETFYIAAVAESSANALRLTSWDVLFASAITLPLALLAAWLPAWEAATVPPIEATRGLGTRLSTSALRRLVIAAVLCLGCGWALTWCEPLGGRPVWGFVAELLFMLGGALLTPLVLLVACRVSRRVASIVLPGVSVEWRLASANLLSGLPRVSVSVAALAVSLSMMVAITVMVGSFRETVVYWLDSVLSAELSAKPVMQTSAVGETRLSAAAVETIRSDRDVIDTIWFASRQIPFRDSSIRLTATELGKAVQRGRLLFKSSRPTEAELDSLGSDRVLVSDSFALRFGVEKGQVVELPTANGSAEFLVVGVYYDYASNQGTVMLDSRSLGRHYGDADLSQAPQHLSIYLAPGADAEEVRMRLLNEMGDEQQVYCVTSSEVRQEAMRIFESTFTITYALQVIAIVVAGLGVASTLITLIYQRQREIGMLSLIGATCRQVRRVIMIEAVILGAVSQFIGISVGVVLALVLIFVINVQSFGWTIQVHVPWWFLAQSTVLVIIAAATFGLYPAVRAASVDALQTVREE